jgi:hypothetical protein
MGTNLSQVFVSDALTMLSGTTFNSSGATTDDVGIWKLDATAGYLATALFQSGFDVDTEEDDSTTGLTYVKNPLWLVNDIQIVQRGAPHFIASPMISTRNIRRIKYENHTASVMHKITLDCGAQVGKDITLKFVIRNTPTAQLNFRDEAATNAMDLSGGGFEFPLGGFNTTNHKVLSVQSTPSDSERATDNEAGLYDAFVRIIAAHPVLNALIKTTDNATSGLVLEARHAGVVFDLIAINDTDDTDLNTSVTLTAASKVGVGNDWQVLSEEIRCRSRYGNFNRMYFPSNVTTYGQVGSAYDKITIEYEHNWPNSTGIAPAGALNQAVIYYTSAGADPSTSASEFDNVFGYTQGTDQEFVW